MPKSERPLREQMTNPVHNANGGTGYTNRAYLQLVVDAGLAAQPYVTSHVNGPFWREVSNAVSKSVVAIRPLPIGLAYKQCERTERAKWRPIRPDTGKHGSGQPRPKHLELHA